MADSTPESQAEYYYFSLEIRKAHLSSRAFRRSHEAYNDVDEDQTRFEHIGPL